MTLALSLTDANGTINLNANGYRVMRYVPLAGDGQKTTETIDIEIVGSSQADMQAKWAAIGSIFNSVRDYEETKIGVWPTISYQPDGYASAYTSNLFYNATVGMQLTPGKSVERYPWARYRIDALITLSRQDWFDGPSTQATLVNDNGSGYSASPFNNNDLSGSSPNFRENWVEILGAGLLGDLPSPTLITFTNTSGNAGIVETLIIAHNYKHAGLTNWFEVEGLAGITQKPGAPDTSYSGSYYGEKTWAVTSETKIFDLALNSGTTLGAKGAYFNAIVRLISPATDMWLRWKLYAPNGVDTPLVWTGPWFNTNQARELWNTGPIQIPPMLMPSFTPGPLTLSLYAKRNSGANTIDMDWLALAPTNSFRTFRAVSGALQSNFSISDDSFQQRTWQSSGGTVYNYFSAMGSPIYLVPKFNNFLYFYWNTADAGYPALATKRATVSVNYYPRRRLI